nr:reverse transcriptase domain-containing protein [Tanacetum cinerariifolium]
GEIVTHWFTLIVLSALRRSGNENKLSFVILILRSILMDLQETSKGSGDTWAARRWLEKEPSRSITTWDDLVSKFINEFFPPSRTTNLRNEISNFQQKFEESFHEAWERYKDLLCACPHYGFTELHQLDTFYNALNPADQDSLNAAAGGSLLEKSPQDALTVIENKSKCLAAGGNTFPEYGDNIQGYVSAATGNYNQGNPGYRPLGVANQMRPPGFAQPNVQNNQNRFGQPQGFNRSPNFNQEQPNQATESNQNFHLNELEKIKMMNHVSLKAMQNQIDMVKNELRNEIKTSIQTSLSNQTNEIKNMMASLLQMNTASTAGSGTLPGNTIANPKGELKSITTRSGLVTKGPTVPNPPKSVNPEEDECVEETYRDPNHTEYNIKKQQEKDDIQIQKFWNMFKQLHLNITLAEALVLMPKYQKMLKALSSELAKLTHAVNQQTSAVTTAMMAMLSSNSNQTHLQPRLRLLRKSVLPVEVLIRTTSVLPPVATLSQSTGITFKVTFQQPQETSIRNFHLNELEKIKRMNDVSLKAMQNQIDMVKNELRNEMKTAIQTSLSNQTNEINNMMASLLQINTASTSGSGTLPGNTIANPKGELKAITTQSGLATEGPTVPNPKLVNLEEDECVEETYTDPDHAEYNIKVPPSPPVQKPKPQIQRNFVIHTRDSLPSLLMPKYQKMLKALLYNKEKLQELANTPLNENCSAVMLKKLPEKLGDPEKFLILCGFSELKCKALADLGASINLMPLSVWRKLGLPDLIPTQMTLELANRAICTPDGIARDVFVPVGKFTFSADFVVVDSKSDPRVPLILGRPFLRTTRTLIDVHGEEMILRDGDERLTLNMKHDTASYSNHPYRESVNLINIFNLSSEDCLKDLVSHKQSGNPTFSLHKEIASPKVIPEFHDSKGCTFLS